MPAGTTIGLDPRTRNARLHFAQLSSLATIIAIGSITSQAQAQETTEVAAPEVAAPHAVESPSEPAAPLVEPTPPPPPEPPPAVEEPPPPPAAAPTLKIGVGMRTGLTMTAGDGSAKLSLNDGLADQINIRPYLTGQLNDYIAFFTQFEIGTFNGLGGGHPGFAILDGMAQVKIADEFQVWLGQHIPANDRNNMNGPFFANGWNFPIVVPAYPFDAGARDRGVTFWGLVSKGLLKYQLSMVDLQTGRKIGKSRFAGRVTLQLLEPDMFYYNSGTNYGKADMLNLGAVFHYQKGEPDTDSDYFGASVDAIFEKNLGSAGTFTIDAIYWNHKGIGDNYTVNQGSVDMGLGVASPNGQSFMVGASWLTPEKIGIGQIQPNVRLQWADYGGPTNLTLDVGIGYIIDGFNDRWYLNYRHVAVEDEDGTDMFQVGVQLMM